MSHELAYAIRGLGIYLYNEHGMLDAVQKLTKGLQEVFAELPEVAAMLYEDSKTLEDHYKQRQDATEQLLGTGEDGPIGGVGTPTLVVEADVGLRRRVVDLHPADAADPG